MVFFGTYDIPSKGTDGQWNEGSEEVYDFVIGTIGPYSGDYEVETPEFGFLFHLLHLEKKIEDLK